MMRYDEIVAQHASGQIPYAIITEFIFARSLNEARAIDQQL